MPISDAQRSAEAPAQLHSRKRSKEPPVLRIERFGKTPIGQALAVITALVVRSLSAIPSADLLL